MTRLIASMAVLVGIALAAAEARAQYPGDPYGLRYQVKAGGYFPNNYDRPRYYEPVGPFDWQYPRPGSLFPNNYSVPRNYDSPDVYSSRRYIPPLYYSSRRYVYPGSQPNYYSNQSNYYGGNQPYYYGQ